MTSVLFFLGSMCSIVNAMPLARPHVDWMQQAGPQCVVFSLVFEAVTHTLILPSSTQCLTRVSPDDKFEFHARLLESRSLREAAGLYERDPLQDTFVFNVSFNIVYTNETLEGGYVP